MNAPPDRRAADHRAAISAHCRSDEAARVAALAAELAAIPLDRVAVAEHARALVVAVRQQRDGASGVDNLMHEFSLSTQEGITLMCLAEALLRIPDTATRDRLIRDKIAKGDWRAHLGHSHSLFVNAATWGLMLTGRLVATHSEHTLGGSLASLIARGGEPLIRSGMEFAMGLLGQQFVMGETIAAALKRSEASTRHGYTHSFDMLGEAAATRADAEAYTDAYAHAIHAIGKASAGRGVVNGPGISIKLSALHPRYCRAQRQRVMDELYPRLAALMQLACGYNIGVNIDAEEADRLELSLDLVERLLAEPDLAGWTGLGVVVQAYQKRCPFVIEHLAERAREHGRRIMIRLVKGAYWDAEIKRAQVDGLAGYPVFTRKVHTDLSYLACAARLLAVADRVYPQFATHNAHTLASVAQMAADKGVTEYEFQCLHGMGEPLYDNVVTPGQPGGRCRIYAPVGNHASLLPYLVRRLLENGANTSFVNRIVDEAVPVDALLTDPLDAVRRDGGHPHPAIPLPRDLFGPTRRNSAGLDLASDAEINRLDAELALLASRPWSAEPILASHPPSGTPYVPVTNPANRQDQVGTVLEATLTDVARAVDAADTFADDWHAVPPPRRASALRAAADAFEAHQTEFISLCIREAGKTRANAVAEVREAVDFCRYYAAQIEHLPPSATAPGPVVCISPWNFPLAIFVGEVVAALAAGSPVLAKPAEQTPLTAALAVHLLHAAGVPRAALQLLPGQGERVGAALVADPRIRGVVFTGSTEVAQLIHRQLAQRPADAPPARLIAETGGQNAMIVDASALPEQVVQDALASAFDSAGQRCSALRVLCLQEEIADRVIELLTGAMMELAIGNPARLSTDVGPVIDDTARAALLAHIDRLRTIGHRVIQCPLPDACATGSFVPPTLIEIDSIAELLEREVFGPVLHVLRYHAGRLDELIDTINATGYGLTFGMHSRIDERIGLATRRVRAGNLYINRNLIGAVVGVQPFGGEGKSGTGPKAGGPFYLPRLMGDLPVPPATLGLTPDDSGVDDCRLARFDTLRAWAHHEGLRSLAEACADFATTSSLACRATLSGPTGERNTLGFTPRGTILCVADDRDTLLVQFAAALASGNTPAVVHGAVAAAALDALPDGLAAAVVQIDEDAILAVDGVLHAGSPERRADLHRKLAEHPARILPLLEAGPDGRYPLYRLVVERAVSINTAAAGGNTSLMTLAA